MNFYEKAQEIIAKGLQSNDDKSEHVRREKPERRVRRHSNHRIEKTK